MEENQKNKQSFASKPKEGEPWDVIIIGSGPAALTAAIYTTRGAASTLILGGTSWGGQLMLTTTVDNYPGFPEGIEGPELMTKMRSQAERFGAEFREIDVTKVDLNKKPYELFSDNGDKFLGNTVILATGAQTKWLGVLGEDKLRGRGVSSCAPCDAPFFKDKKTMVVGGGDSAMEEALVLTKYSPEVVIVHRRDQLKASAAMQDKVMNNNKISILWDTEIVEMVGENVLQSVKLKTKLDSEQAKKLKSGELEKYNGEVIEEKDGMLFWQRPTDGIFVAIGHKPATDIFSGQVELDEKNHIKRYEDQAFKSKTNLEVVFVAGDVHDYHYRQAVTAAGFGCMAGMDVLNYLDKATPSW